MSSRNCVAVGISSGLRICALLGCTLLSLTGAQAQTVLTTIPIDGSTGLAVNPVTNIIYASGPELNAIDGLTNTVTPKKSAFGNQLVVNPNTNTIYVIDSGDYYPCGFACKQANEANDQWPSFQQLGGVNWPTVLIGKLEVWHRTVWLESAFRDSSVSQFGDDASVNGLRLVGNVFCDELFALGVNFAKRPCFSLRGRFFE